MEELLNKLIEKGWKPSWKECTHFIRQYDADILDWKLLYTAIRKDKWVYNIHYTLRELVSKESWLWQFVCENGMVNCEWKWKDNIVWRCYNINNNDVNYKYWEDYEYRLIESALCDEDKLEDFILSNIKVDGNI